MELVKIEADLPENEHLLEKYGVASLPAFVIENKGQVWGILVGAKPEKEMREWIRSHVETQEILDV